MVVDQNDKAIVVIGSGAGGGTIADRLTAAGKSVVLLEAGGHVPPAEWHQDDLASFAQLSWLDPRVASGSYLAAQVAPSMPAWIAKALGGSTLIWNGLAYRAQEHEFKSRSHYGAIDGASLIDWPIEYGDLAPYYEEAERRLGVTGTEGIPAHAPSNLFKVVHEAARRCGYNNVTNEHIAINSAARDGRPGCLQMGFCNQGCKINAKWSTLASELPRAQASGRLDLRSGCQATRIDVDRRGKASAVIYRDAAGVEQRQRVGTLFLACNAIETARLLLMSDSAAFPDGLGNGSGQVGRNYTRHTIALAFARMPEPVNMHRGIVTPGAIFDEARHDPARGFAGGYLMEALGLAPVNLALMVGGAEWGADFAEFMGDYDYLAGVLLNGEELPRADNRITLDAAVKDAYGLPVANVHVDEHPHCAAMRGHFRERVETLFSAVGGTGTRHGIPPSATHNMGTARMSENPADGVTDKFGRSHEVENLFVGDGSVFSSSTAENPTLTIVALALRQADHFLSAVA